MVALRVKEDYMISIMVGIIIVCLFAFLLLGAPMFLGMIVGPALVLIGFSDIPLSSVMQTLTSGISSFVLVAVPMFIFAAEIMCKGQCAERLINLMRVFFGHFSGGLAITAAGTCTFFGAISGSAQATFVAVGRPMAKEMVSNGWRTSHALGILMSAANIAWLIPPSVCMIFYCLVTSVSIAELFLAGIGPGFVMFLLFSIYEWIIAKKRNIQTLPKASWHDRIVAIREALIPLGFPVIILGGIYSGVFSPTEAAAISVLYAVIVEMLIYRSITIKDIYRTALSTGAVTASVFILIAAGNMISWVLSFAGIPQWVMSHMMAADASALSVLFIISAAFFIGCMFVDSLPLIMILTPIFFPVTSALGINPIQLGIIIVILSAMGSITPPFGVNLFTAMAIFNQPYERVVKGIMPYIAIFVVMVLLCIFIPQVALSSWYLFF